MSSRSRLIKDYRTVLRHLKRIPSPSNSSVFLDLVRRRGSRSPELNERILRAYAANVSSVAELTHLRQLDSGDKLNQRDKIRVMSQKVGLTPPKFADEFEESLLDQTNSDKSSQ